MSNNRSTEENYVIARFRQVQEHFWGLGLQRCRMSEIPVFKAQGATVKPSLGGNKIEAEKKSGSSSREILLGEVPGPHDEYARKNIPGLAELQLSAGLVFGGKNGRKGDPHLKSVGAVLTEYIEKRGVATYLNEGSLRENWAAVVGDENAKHTFIEQIENGNVVIRCDSTQWAAILRYYIPQIMTRIEQVYPDLKIQKIVVLGPQGPSWNYGPRSVPGRGVRDTYG